MFGYIRPYEGELKLWQLQAYKACYCGVCRSLGRRTRLCSACANAQTEESPAASENRRNVNGTTTEKKERFVWRTPLNRLMLRYDLAFLALVRAAQDGAVFTEGRCPLHPFRRQEMLSKEQSDYAATLHILLSHAKWRDDLTDRHYVSALPYLVFLPDAKRAQKQLPELSQAIADMLQKQNALEKANCADADEIAEPFAQLMRQLFAYGTEGGAREALSYLGYTVGKFIVWADALDDFERDKKAHRYNVFANLYPDFASAKQAVAPLLYACAQGAQAAFDLLEESALSGIAENILQEGMLSTIEGLGEKKKKTQSLDLTFHDR